MSMSIQAQISPVDFWLDEFGLTFKDGDTRIEFVLTNKQIDQLEQSIIDYREMISEENRKLGVCDDSKR